MPVSHAFTSTKPDDADATLVRPSNWNHNHITDVDLQTEVHGTLQAANLGAFTGDVTSSGYAITLNTVNSNVGTFGSASQVATVTFNAKGLATAASNTAIQIAESQVTNLVADLALLQPKAYDISTYSMAQGA
jgi:hypothetical protein